MSPVLLTSLSFVAFPSLLLLFLSRMDIQFPKNPPALSQLSSTKSILVKQDLTTGLAVPSRDRLISHCGDLVSSSSRHSAFYFSSAFTQLGSYWWRNQPICWFTQLRVQVAVSRKKPSGLVWCDSTSICGCCRPPQRAFPWQAAL